MINRIYQWILVAPMLSAIAFSVQAKESALVQTKDLIKTFMAVTPLPDDGSALNTAQRKSNANAFHSLDSFFNYERLTLDPINPHQTKFNNEQLTKFKNLFREVIRLVAFPDSGTFLKRAEYTLKINKRSKVKQIQVEMYTLLKEEDLETTVLFHWEDQGKGLKIVDVSFDGASLIKDYTNQFGRIISKDGTQGLIRRLEKRLKKEQGKGII